jgi:hypothetical protein
MTLYPPDGTTGTGKVHEKPPERLLLSDPDEH